MEKFELQTIGDFGDDGIYRFDLSQLAEQNVTSITIFDDRIISGGDGTASGFDLDFIAISEINTSIPSMVNDILVNGDVLNVFDFSNGVIFTPGFKQPAVTPQWVGDNLFGTSNGNEYDASQATLGIFDGDETVRFAGTRDTSLSLGEGGAVTLTLTSALSSSGKFLYVGDVGGGNDSAFVAFNVSSSDLGVDLIGTSGDDSIILGENENVGTGSGNDNIDGAGGNDTISTLGGNDSLLGNSGNDVFTGGGGRDTIDGGTGTDTANFSGRLSDYQISKSGSTYTILDNRSGSPDGTDSIISVENLHFSDQSIEIDASTGSDTPSSALKTLFDSNADAAKGLTVAYVILFDGIPNHAGYTFLIDNAVNTNFGAGTGVTFNSENIFINLVNNLVQGNTEAKANFDALAIGQTLFDKVSSLYGSLVPTSMQTTEGLSFITRAEGLQFYENVAVERGVGGTDGAAIVAMASILKITVDGDFGIGNSVNDLFKAVSAESSIIPILSTTFIPLEFADGTAFDGDDAGAIAITAAALSQDTPYDDFRYTPDEAEMDGVPILGHTEGYGVNELA